MLGRRTVFLILALLPLLSFAQLTDGSKEPFRERKEWLRGFRWFMPVYDTERVPPGTRVKLQIPQSVSTDIRDIKSELYLVDTYGSQRIYSFLRLPPQGTNTVESLWLSFTVPANVKLRLFYGGVSLAEPLEGVQELDRVPVRWDMMPEVQLKNRVQYLPDVSQKIKKPLCLMVILLVTAGVALVWAASFKKRI